MSEPERRVPVFFYGSFINLDVLAEVGIAPAEDEVEVASLTGFDIRIDPLANLRADLESSVWGIIVRCTHAELECLYGQSWVGTYHPEAVAAQTRDGRLVPCLCYISPRMDSAPPAPDYVERIIAPAERWRFPEAYLERLRAWRAKARG